MRPPEQFIRKLSRESPTATLENPYHGRSALARLRKANLQSYLEKMQAQRPTVLLLGEAPGYNGCGRTGIPFTSERTLLEEPFFRSVDYRIADPNAPAQSEKSATIFWEAIRDWEPMPLIWNIFPFHPHLAGNLRSNRRPNAGELEKGLQYLVEFLEMFPIRRIGAVGKMAEGQLKTAGLEIPWQYVRHPSFGGKNEFLRGIEAMRR